MAIRKVGVLGCGLMGSGIAQVAAQAGYEVVVREVEQKFLDKGLAGIQKSLGKFVEKGKMQQADMDACLGRLKGSTNLQDLADCDIVIEAIIENAQLKKDTYAELDRIVKPEAIFASNTSSLTITELSMATARPKQFVGLHFFNPVPLMKLVEVVRTILTSDEAFNTALAEGIGAVYPYLGGAHEPVVKLANENNVITMSAGSSKACERTDLDYQIEVAFDAGDYLDTIFKEILAGTFTEGDTRVFRVGVDPEPGAFICDPTPEQEAAMAEVFAKIAAGDFVDQFGAIKGQAYSGG
jgi:hypothetical protein